MILFNKKAERINAATEEKQDAIIALLGGANKPQTKPDFFDTTTSATVVYEGWKTTGTTCILCKLDLTAGTRTYGSDTWANRLTATYE